MILVQILIFLTSFAIQDQTAIVPKALNPEFDKVIRRYLELNVTPISVYEANNKIENFVFLDAREKDEYEVSHIKGARHVGFESFNLGSVRDLDSNQKIIVYCSIGYRSEKVGKKLMDTGFPHVYNLYGSIFEWVNNGYPVYDISGKRTTKVHTYGKSWSKWLDSRIADKIW